MTSTFTIGTAQIDGRVWIRERHVDDLGRVHESERLDVPNADHAARLAVNAALLVEQFRAVEVDRAMDGDGFLVPKYQTLAEFLVRWRERFRASSREETATRATWLLDAIEASRITVAQVRAAFSLTAQQWSDLRDRLLALRAALRLIQSGRGE